MFRRGILNALKCYYSW